MRGDHLLQVRHPTFDLGHAGFGWIHDCDCDCDYDPTDVPAPQRYEQILAAYS